MLVKKDKPSMMMTLSEQARNLNDLVRKPLVSFHFYRTICLIVRPSQALHELSELYNMVRLKECKLYFVFRNFKVVTRKLTRQCIVFAWNVNFSVASIHKLHKLSTEYHVTKSFVIVYVIVYRISRECIKWVLNANMPPGP